MIKKLFESKKNIIIFVIAIVVIIEILMIVSPQSKTESSVTNIPTSQNPNTPSSNPSTTQVQNSNTTLPTSNSLPSISPTPPKETIPTTTEEEILDLDYRRPLSRFLPYQGTYFKANRYVGTNKLEILVKNKADTQLAKEEAQAWLVKNGVDQDDKIIVSYRY